MGWRLLNSSKNINNNNNAKNQRKINTQKRLCHCQEKGRGMSAGRGLNDFAILGRRGSHSLL